MPQRLKFFVIVCALILGGCSASLPTRPPFDPVQQLRRNIDAVLADSLFVQARPSVKVLSLKTGEVLYARDPKVLMRPASNLKLFTSATALHELGPRFQFTTSILADSLRADSIVHGNLYIKGSGDPDLLTADLDSLSLLIKRMGISQVSGDIVGDVSYFDNLYWGNGWMWDDEPDPDEMFISALSVNKNCVSILVGPAATPGDPAQTACNPPTPFVTIVSSAKTVKDSVTVPLRISRLFQERLNTVTVRGEILLGDTTHENRLSVWEPELYSTELFKESLQRNGIVVLGQPRIGMAPFTAQPLCGRNRSLDSVIVAMNKVSDNLSAENILKTLGAERRGLPGSARNGISVINNYLTSIGIDTAGHNIADGSGVSHYNLVSVDEIIRLLGSVARDSALFPVFYASLPVAGRDGSLQNRMVGTAAEGNLRGKTGTLSGVSSLSGYVTTRDGEPVVFAIFMQNFVAPTRLFQYDQDRIGALIAGFSRKQVVAASH